MPAYLRQSPLYRSSPNTLHQPLPGYKMAKGRFKTRDAHGNLQVTFRRHAETGRLAADIDIDEASGIEREFEVVRNAVWRADESVSGSGVSVGGGPVGAYPGPRVALIF
jgi:hypothetical protein